MMHDRALHLQCFLSFGDTYQWDFGCSCPGEMHCYNLAVSVFGLDWALYSMAEQLKTSAFMLSPCVTRSDPA